VQPEYRALKAAPVGFGSDAAVPPWVGYNEEETIQQQILALSAVSQRETFIKSANKLLFKILCSKYTISFIVTI
jgi:hypothetical protein